MISVGGSWATGNNVLAAELYEGRISYAEFNKRRAALNAEGSKAVQTWLAAMVTGGNPQIVAQAQAAEGQLQRTLAAQAGAPARPALPAYAPAASPATPPQAQASGGLNPCTDPAGVARLTRSQYPDVSPEVTIGALEKLQELYGCRAPAPPLPLPPEAFEDIPGSNQLQPLPQVPYVPPLSVSPSPPKWAPGFPPLAILPPLGTSSCRPVYTCDASGRNCDWQQVCR
jgi:hypothetical protein